MGRLINNILPTNKILKGAGNHKLTVSGSAEVSLDANGIEFMERIYLVDDLVRYYWVNQQLQG